MKKAFRVVDKYTHAIACKAVAEIDYTKPMQVKIELFIKNRSLKQNKLLHMWLTMINNHVFETTGKSHGVDAWKLFFKKHFLGVDVIRMPDGSWHEQIRKTSRCNTKELTEFLERIDAWANSEIDLILPHPDDIYFEAMGLKR